MFNAANEVAVEAFLGKRIRFGDIPEVIATVLDRHDAGDASDLGAILDADRWARREGEVACSSR